jgi:pimeloyl-ACP methyl ester carboxylesterase
MADNVTTETVDVRGLKLKVQQAGSGETILFLHGAGGSNWTGLLDRLATKYHVLLPEHPGFGRSQIPDWMMSTGDLALFYLDFIDALKLDNVHLAGHSLGGWLTAEIAIRNTSRLRSVSLLAPAGIAVDAAPFGDVFLWNHEQSTRAQFHDQALAEKRLTVAPDLGIALQNKSAVARLAWNPRFSNPQLPFWLHRIDRPTLLLWGKQDRVIPYACHVPYKKGIAQAQMEVIDQCGHAIHNEKPAEAAAIMEKFLSGVKA